MLALSQFVSPAGLAVYAYMAGVVGTPMLLCGRHQTNGYCLCLPAAVAAVKTSQATHAANPDQALPKRSVFNGVVTFSAQPGRLAWHMLWHFGLEQFLPLFADPINMKTPGAFQRLLGQAGTFRMRRQINDSL